MSRKKRRRAGFSQGSYRLLGLGLAVGGTVLVVHTVPLTVWYVILAGLLICITALGLFQYWK